VSGADFAIVEERARAARERSMAVVVVQGLGFVGAVMSAVVAAARGAQGEPRYFVVGVDLAAAADKVRAVNEGRPPVPSADPQVAAYLQRAVNDTRSLVATCDPRAYGLADVIVVDVNFDIGGLDAFKRAIQDIGEHMSANALVLIETTVPPGTTREVVLPMLRAAFAARGLGGEPLIAHSYERVTPGRNYVASVERFWRSYAAESEEAERRARNFLASVIRTDAFPLRRLESTVASELAKVLENSYRAVNIALIHEWTLAAEDLGVNLFDIVDSIAVRRGTHDNIRKPGFGVGGYCLTKDSHLAQWGIASFFGSDVRLSLTLSALEVNERMPEHTFDLLAAALGELRGLEILVAGVSYLHDVADTRNSPTATFCTLVEQAGATPLVHDPLVQEWPERPHVARVSLDEGVARAHAIVVAVRHQAFLELDPRRLAGPRVRCVVDTQDILPDAKAAALHAAGIHPVGVGKGHWKARFAKTARP
jgi:UDP-N-acetyl-D-glucosamine dehydrogenase